jgi:hypothetical protein
MNEERRKHPRRSWELTVPFSVSGLDNMESRKMFLYGNTIDISATGLCIATHYHLEPGQVLSFGNQRLIAVVKWGEKLDHSYRVGIKFI